MAVMWSLICFALLVLFRYVRLVVSICAYCRYKATPVGDSPTYFPSDITVIIPSVDCSGDLFLATVQSALWAGVSKVIVVTISDNKKMAKDTCKHFGSKVQVLACSFANKRSQLCIGLRQVKTDVVMLMDDHVWFRDPVQAFHSILAPLDDPMVGAVAVGKKVQRVWSSCFCPLDILNAIACLYLDRHNFGKSPRFLVRNMWNPANVSV